MPHRQARSRPRAVDSLIAASARALARGDALGALKCVALRTDPPALAVRGIAMARLGEHARARQLLRRAARGFGPREPVAHARCVVAEAEVALAMRDFSGAGERLASAAATLAARGDHANATQAWLVVARKSLLLGRLDAAAGALARLHGQRLSPALSAVAELAAAELALRSVRNAEGRAALARARHAAQNSAIPALIAEVEHSNAVLGRVAARGVCAGVTRALRLEEVEALLASDVLVVDGCRRRVQSGGRWRPLARRPVLFTLAQALAAAWPEDAERGALIQAAFRARNPDETHRARLRVEIGRLRALLRPVARIEASERGFVLVPHGGQQVVLLLPPVDGQQAAVLALLADGAAWSTSALALAMQASQRTVQRMLADLQAEGRLRAIGSGRSQRWLAPPLGAFTTILLLPGVLPPD